MKGIISLGGQPLTLNRFNSIYERGDFLIGVDSGCQFFYDNQLTPDLVLGDFDSIDADLLSYYKKQGIAILEYPRDKDYTDGELALLEGRKRGCQSLLIVGTGEGSSTDHFLGNFFLLSHYREAFIVTEGEWISLLSEGLTKVYPDKGSLISLVPLNDVEIKLKGFLYEGRFTTTRGKTLTLRNTLNSQEGLIHLLSGEMYLIQGKK